MLPSDIASLDAELQPLWRQEAYSELIARLSGLFPNSETARRYLNSLSDRAESLRQTRNNLLSGTACGFALLPLTDGVKGFARFLQVLDGADGLDHQRQSWSTEFERALSDASSAITVFVEKFLGGFGADFTGSRIVNIRSCDPANDGVPLTGRSVGLPAAAALFSHWSGLPIPRGIVLTGAFQENGTLIVDGVGEKLSFLTRELVGEFKLLVAGEAAGNANFREEDSPVVYVRTLENALDVLWPDTWRMIRAPLTDYSAAKQEAERVFINGAYDRAAAIFRRIGESAGEDGRATEVFRARWREGVAKARVGYWVDAWNAICDAVERGEQLHSSERISSEEFSRAILAKAVCAADAYRFDNALTLVESALEHLGSTSHPLSRARVFGTRGLVLCQARQFDSAVENYDKAADLLHGADARDELPRTFCWRAIAQAELGNARASWKDLAQGRAHNGRIRHAARRQLNARFLTYAECRIAVRLGEDQALGPAEDSTQRDWLSASILRYRAQAALTSGLPSAESVCAGSVEMFQDLYHGETIAPMYGASHLMMALIYTAKGQHSQALDHCVAAAAAFRRFSFAASYFQDLIPEIETGNPACASQALSLVNY